MLGHPERRQFGCVIVEWSLKESESEVETFVSSSVSGGWMCLYSSW